MSIKNANQLKAKIKNLARQQCVDARILMRLYMMERFLERVAKSKYKNNFVLKGGMLISYLVGVNNRTTMDIDTTMENISLDKQDVQKFLSEIMLTEVNDGVNFQLLSLNRIMEDADYPGIRANLIANFDGTKTPVKIDISTGHVITPKAIDMKLSLMFSNPIMIQAYPVETILAEKLQTILSRGEFNTRMRDYYDIHALRVAQGDKRFKNSNLSDALFATSQRRSTLYILEKGKKIFADLQNSEVLLKRWKEYQIKTPWSRNLAWEEVIKDLHFFLTIALLK